MRLGFRADPHGCLREVVPRRSRPRPHPKLLAQLNISVKNYKCICDKWPPSRPICQPASSSSSWKDKTARFCLAAGAGALAGALSLADSLRLNRCFPSVSCLAAATLALVSASCTCSLAGSSLSAFSYSLAACDRGGRGFLNAHNPCGGRWKLYMSAKTQPSSPPLPSAPIAYPGVILHPGVRSREPGPRLGPLGIQIDGPLRCACRLDPRRGRGVRCRQVAPEDRIP